MKRCAGFKCWGEHRKIVNKSYSDGNTVTTISSNESKVTKLGNCTNVLQCEHGSNVQGEGRTAEFGQIDHTTEKQNLE